MRKLFQSPLEDMCQQKVKVLKRFDNGNIIFECDGNDGPMKGIYKKDGLCIERLGPNYPYVVQLIEAAGLKGTISVVSYLLYHHQS